MAPGEHGRAAVFYLFPWLFIYLDRMDLYHCASLKYTDVGLVHLCIVI